MASHHDPVLIPADNPGSLTGSGNNTWLIDGARADAHRRGRRVGSTRRGRGPSPSRAVARSRARHSRPSRSRLGCASAPARRGRRSEACKRAAPRRVRLARAVRRRDGSRRSTACSPSCTHRAMPPDHACFWDPEARHLYTGDMLILGTSVMIPFGRGGSLREYLRSLERLAALQPGGSFPGHGRVIDRPLEVIDEYLETPAAARASDPGLSGRTRVTEVEGSCGGSIPGCREAAVSRTLDRGSPSPETARRGPSDVSPSDLDAML